MFSQLAFSLRFTIPVDGNTGIPPLCYHFPSTEPRFAAAEPPWRRFICDPFFSSPANLGSILDEIAEHRPFNDRALRFAVPLGFFPSPVHRTSSPVFRDFPLDLRSRFAGQASSIFSAGKTFPCFRPIPQGIPRSVGRSCLGRFLVPVEAFERHPISISLRRISCFVLIPAAHGFA